MSRLVPPALRMGIERFLRIILAQGLVPGPIKTQCQNRSSTLRPRAYMVTRLLVQSRAFDLGLRFFVAF